jgi:hypothetical protein
MACCFPRATRTLKQLAAQLSECFLRSPRLPIHTSACSSRGTKRRNSDFAIRVLPVLCVAAALTSEQLEEKMPVR